jgi:hypothetical protein
MTNISKEESTKLEKYYSFLPLIRFEYENPISIDFISWRKMIDENNKFIITSTQIYDVNILPRIQLYPRFVNKYNEYVRRREEKRLKKELYEYKPPAVVKDKIILPDLIKSQCMLMIDTKKWLKKLTIPLQITYTPILPIPENVFENGHVWRVRDL